MSILNLYLGPMYSGKTTQLIKIYEECLDTNITPFCVKPFVDNRYKRERITTHNDEKGRCKEIKALPIKEGVLPYFAVEKIADVLLIDELTLFSDASWLINVLKECLKMGYSIHASALNYYWDGSVPPIVENLRKELEINETHFKAKCSVCGKEAVFTGKTAGSLESLIEVGDYMYMPFCKNHFSRLRRIQRGKH